MREGSVCLKKGGSLHHKKGKGIDLLSGGRRCPGGKLKNKVEEMGRSRMVIIGKFVPARDLLPLKSGGSFVATYHQRERPKEGRHFHVNTNLSKLQDLKALTWGFIYDNVILK